MADLDDITAPTLTPYLSVHDARKAIDWYAAVFGAQLRGEPFAMDDGRIGHAELVIADAVLLLADEFPEEDLAGPIARGGPSQSIVIHVPDTDEVVARAQENGATLQRPVADEPYGRMGVFTDPFGHRWMALQRPG